MVVAIVGDLRFKLDKHKHTVAYAEAAGRAQVVDKGTTDLSGSIKAVVAQGEEDAVRLVRQTVVERLRLYAVDPADFVFTMRTTEVGEDKTFWLMPAKVSRKEYSAISPEEVSDVAQS